LLREGSLLVPPRLVGRAWAEVQAVLRSRRLAVIESWENGDAVHSYHLARKKAFSLPSGHSLDLVLLLSAPNQNRGRQPARPGRLHRADVALVADINVPYATVVSEKRYPEGTILGLILSEETVKAVGAVWPVLKRVVVYYGYLGNRWCDENPSGFHVE